MNAAFSVGPGRRPKRKNVNGMKAAPHQTNGVQRRVSGRPVGNSWGMSVSSGPAKNAKDQDAIQASAIAPGSEPGAMITARVAYSWTNPPKPVARPATSSSQPTAFRGCRRAIRRPAVANTGAVTSEYPRKPQLSGTWASRLTRTSTPPAAANTTATAHEAQAT